MISNCFSDTFHQCSSYYHKEWASLSTPQQSGIMLGAWRNGVRDFQDEALVALFLREGTPKDYRDHDHLRLNSLSYISNLRRADATAILVGVMHTRIDATSMKAALRLMGLNRGLAQQQIDAVLERHERGDIEAASKHAIRFMKEVRAGKYDSVRVD